MRGGKVSLFLSISGKGEINLMLVELTKAQIGELLELLEAEINLNGNEDDLKPIAEKLKKAKSKRWWKIQFRKKGDKYV